MSATAARAATEPAPVFFEVVSADGTRLQAWTNDADDSAGRPTVLLCNGLGTNAWAWPALLRPDCGVRVVSWNHRGTGGSERPADPHRVGIEEHVEDAVAVMDHCGVGSAVAIGWSMGVNTMFELAVRQPARVRGLFAVAGVPGDSFATMLGPFRLPRHAARAVTVNLSRALRLGGRAVTPVTTRIPVGPRLVRLLTHSGFMLPVPDPELAAVAIEEFLTTPVEWYSHLALRASEHARVPLSGIRVPTRFVGGTFDLLAGARAMRTAADRIPGASYVELRGSHFLQMEQPDRVHELLLELLDEVR